MAREAIDFDGYFRGRAESFQFNQRDGVLVVRGNVPSIYLKQVLQSVLMRLDGVRTVDNQVSVISPHGLSSVSKKTDEARSTAYRTVN